MTRVFLFALLTSTPATAIAQFDGVGSGSTVDWWARGVSIAAILISLAIFVFSRWDKWRDRKAGELARLPIVEIVMEPRTDPYQWLVKFSFQNRAEIVDIEEIEIVEPAGALLKQSAYPTAPDGSRRAIPSSGPWARSISKLSRLHPNSSRGFEYHLLKLEQTHKEAIGLTAKFILKLRFVDNRDTQHQLVRTAKF